MPSRAPRLCTCGRIVQPGQRCEHVIVADRERKARFDQKRAPARERGYTTKWQREREAYLQANPTCRRDGCGKPATVVDHVIPHRGDLKLFWRRSNWQPLCRSCHAGWKQRAECAEVRP